MEFFAALSQYGFLQTALIASLLASISCGVIGTFVVVKRIGFLAGSIAHSVLGGMGAAIYLGLDPLLGALVAALLSALFIGLIRLYWKAQEDTLIGALWATGMAVGILFIAQTPGYSGDLMSYLFGNILLVPQQYLLWMALLDISLIVVIALFYRQLLAVTFDEEFARLRGVRVGVFYLLLLCLVAVTVVLLLQVVGLILVIALLTLPAAIALLFSNSLLRIMMLATLLGIGFTSSGLALAYSPNWPVGPVIILIAVSCYLLALGGSQLYLARKRRQTITNALKQAT